MTLIDERTKRDKKRKILKILTAVFLVFFLSSSFLFMAPQPARANMPVVDAIGNAWKVGDTIWQKVTNVLRILAVKVAATAVSTAVTNTLGQLAYDEAVYLGSGGEGQKPQWLTGDAKTVMSNIGDQAAGTFISSLSKQFGTNLCQPSLSAKVSIGLGLVQQNRPPNPDCTWKQMSENWEKTIKDFQNRGDFTKQLASMFEVTGGKTDLSAALILQSGSIKAQAEARANQQLSMISGSAGLYVDNRNIAGTIKGMPGNQEQFDKLRGEQNAALLQTTGDNLVDAVMIFPKQLAITGLQTVLRNLTSSLNEKVAQDSINNPYGASSHGGVTAAQGILRKIVEPKFGSKTDYNILQQLSICNVGVLGGVGPTDCVIDEGFRQAVENRLTVAQALERSSGGSSGLLDDGKPFGFFAEENKSTAYQSGYPSRSISILRKYRIVPVGWELAAQYIKDHFSDSDVSSHANLRDLTACFDPNDSYHGYNDDGTHDWCKGLIDPNWVLKAPQNRCTKQGFGPQILSGQTNSMGVDSNNQPLQEQFQVVRADSYCGDEQTCIKENDDGSCAGQNFGYCTEDKRLWRFGSTGSCEAQFNTCQTFTNSEGNQISYLKNSLQYCDSEQLGCREYAIASPDGYDEKSGSLSWLKNSGSIFLNKNAGTCEQESEGCHEFIRTTSGAGTNLIAHSNLDGDTFLPSGWIPQGTVSLSNSLPDGRAGQAIYVDGNALGVGIYSFDNADITFKSVLPAGFVMEPEIYYTFSADVYLQSGDAVSIFIGRMPAFKMASTSVVGEWRRLSITTLNNKELAANEIGVFGSGGGAAPIQFYVDNLKFEVGAAPTKYSDYHSNNLVYEKFMPAYLRYACYTDPDNGDFSSKTDAAPCNKFARQCNRDEVGCDIFTNNDNPGQEPIPAAITDVDVCPSVCSGYNTYIQSENVFSTAHVAYFIPSTAQSCSSNAVGCQEFTNLASSTAGGEQKAYFSDLRQCVKPSEPGANCQDFYTWEGTAASGQQLVKYSLQAVGADPATTIDDSLLCDSIIYGTNPLLPNYNFDCRQFYDKAGNIYYHLYSKTISCSLNCTSYRMSDKDKIDNVFNNVDCLAASGFWDGATSVCYSCKNGGVWDVGQNACVYQAIPSESRVCSAAEKGCAKYDGNGGANIIPVFTDTFETPATSAWNGGALSGASYTAGGHSYQFTNAAPAYKVVSDSVEQGSSYVLTFLAKTDSFDVEVSAELSSGLESTPFDKTVKIKSAEWRIYTLYMPVLNHAVPPGLESLSVEVVSGADNVYIDNVKLVKITDLYYKIKDSWKTPEICDQDTNRNPYPLFALGCASYSNHLGVNKYLHSFDHICQETAVGCEAMIDTHNTVSAESNSSYGPDMQVATDSLIYVAFDQKYFCGQANQGCERLGLKKSVGGEMTFKDTYLKNNAEKYGSGINQKGIVCDQTGVGCDSFAYTSGGGQASLNFKDPGNQVCEWRQSPKATANKGWGWFKKKVTRCGGTDDICASDKDCTGKSCTLEKDDTLCPTENLKTVGQGGLGNEIMQPGSDGVYQWAGICQDTQSSCTEYIDPVSDFSNNVVYNSDFSQNIGGGVLADSWRATPGNPVQDINLEGGTLYVFSVQGVNQAILRSPIAGTRPFSVLRADNTFDAPVDSISVSDNSSILFYTDTTVKEIYVTNAAPNNPSKIILRKAAVSYQLQDSVNKKDCPNGANPSGGCVYFNERSIKGAVGAFYNPLDPNNFDPWKSYGISGINSAAINLANNLIKVKPDRDCAQWLACKSYIHDENTGNDVCFDIANCNRLDEKSGACVNFPVSGSAVNRVYDPTGANGGSDNSETIKNLTGYVRVGYPSVDEMNDLKIVPNDLISFGLMEQKGNKAVVPNGDFELFIATTTPYNSGVKWIGNPANWSAIGNALGSRIQWTRDTAESLFSIIADLPTAQSYEFSSDRTKSANTYPMIGKSFLRYDATTDDGGYSLKVPFSSVIYVNPGQTYYLSYYINTFKLKGDKTRAKVFIIDGGSNVIASTTQGQKDGWVLATTKFTATDNIVRLLLSATPNSSGNVFIDDIQIAPVLMARQPSSYVDDSLNKTADISTLYDRQTCRLYPQEDSLSCSYYDKSGIFQKGDLGYCLQYDKAPGNPNACLLWWPIDKVKGQGIQSSQNLGYNNRTPLYYCTRANVGETTVSTWNGTDWVGTLASYPFISGLNYDVEETIDVNLNGTTILSEGPVERHGVAGTGLFPLRYGENTMTVYYRSTAGTGETYLRMTGFINYLNAEGSLMLLPFDIADLYNSFDTNGFLHNQIQTRPDGSTFQVVYSCGNATNDAMVQTAWISSGACDGDTLYADGNAITNERDCTEGHLCGDSNAMTMYYTFYIPEPVCSQVASVVDAYGRNKAWVERVSGSQDYTLTCNNYMPDSYTAAYPNSANPSIIDTATVYVNPSDSSLPAVNKNNCTSTSFLSPFGSANPPSGDLSFISNPPYWERPLPYWSSDPKTSGSMGQLYDSNDLKYLFAQSFGVWNWNSFTNSYIQNFSGGDWLAPNNMCNGNSRDCVGANRGTLTKCNCGVAPTVSNITLNRTVSAVINGHGQVAIDFNSKIDPEQSPMNGYQIDWGDGEVIDASGSDMSGAAPHSASHLYDFYDLLNKYREAVSSGMLDSMYPTLNCATTYCTIKPRIKITDNWGWCTEGGVAGSLCPAEGVAGSCMNPSTRAVDGTSCYRNSDCVTTPGVSVCADGWWEASGRITVHNQY